MEAAESGNDVPLALGQVLGYLNYSSGATDPLILRSFNTLLLAIWQEPEKITRPSRLLRDWLLEELDKLHANQEPAAATHESSCGAFANVDQARAVIGLVFDRLWPAYQEYHSDLLFHQREADLLQPFFVAQMCSAVLKQGPTWDNTTRIVDGAIHDLNDYLGYRPVAVLETERKIEPYSHERLRPIPLYIDGAGVAVGRYSELISATLEILRQTDPHLLARAWFDPNLLEELAYDPRAYDFDHPVNKRPNYHFGTWDPHRIDNKGNYRRFVTQQVTLDALLARVESLANTLPREELLIEAAAVLAGTILMASGTCGSGPDAHDSSTTLATLLPNIASYRDDFYQQLLGQLKGSVAERLREEAQQLHQPFGGARQHLNHELARLRAIQLQQVHLAQLFARMGYPEAAARQTRNVPVASARMLCEMYCRLTLGHRAIDRGDLGVVALYLPEVEDQLHRAIQCGALVDPWNILGFDAHFSLFPAMENSIRDYRVDTLIELVEQIFSLCARAWSEAAARDDAALEKRFSDTFDRIANWWDQYATPMVSSVKRVFGKELQISTNLVAGALNAWHKAGAAAGDIAFWRMFVDQFDSPKAFQLVVEALMDKRDHVASLALLMQWLSQTPRISLEDGDSSFHRLAMQWIRSVEDYDSASSAVPAIDQQAKLESAWPLVRKFFDYLEANAETFWLVPQFELTANGRRPKTPEDEELFRAMMEQDEEEDGDGQLFSAAYDEMVFQDSTDDGFEGDMLEGGVPGSNVGEYELEQEADRLTERLAFLGTVARLRKHICTIWNTRNEQTTARMEVYAEWGSQAAATTTELLRLLDAVEAHRIPTPTGEQDSLLEYDRRRMIKEGLLERIIATAVKMDEAAQFLSAASPRQGHGNRDAAAKLLQSLLACDPQAVSKHWPAFLTELETRAILYVPLNKGGNPRRIVEARCTQRLLHNLLAWLPRLGLIRETCELLNAAQNLETVHVAGPGAVTEFDRLFETGLKAIVECLVHSAEAWSGDGSPGAVRRADDALVDSLQQLTEIQLKSWLKHSRTLRLSVAEKLADEQQWQTFVDFVRQYGHDLFTQRFLNLGNLRAILHQGVDVWLKQLEEEDNERSAFKLLEELDRRVPRAQAVKLLTMTLEIVVENYGEYRDYNSTTTQSDRGEMLYMLIDFLRLRVEYDRVAWNLRPVIIAHEIVVKHGRSEAAEKWRRSLAERTCDAADRHLTRLAQLSRQYGMRLPSISDRLSERFVRPLAIDRVRALVAPAMEAAHVGGDLTTFALLEQEIASLAREPSGAGYDVPAWLVALEDEVTRLRRQQRRHLGRDELAQRIPQIPLSPEALREQLDAAESL
jgi:hypothetical protein